MKRSCFLAIIFNFLIHAIVFSQQPGLSVVCWIDGHESCHAAVTRSMPPCSSGGCVYLANNGVITSYCMSIIPPPPGGPDVLTQDKGLHVLDRSVDKAKALFVPPDQPAGFQGLNGQEIVCATVNYCICQSVSPLPSPAVEPCKQGTKADDDPNDPNKGDVKVLSTKPNSASPPCPGIPPPPPKNTGTGGNYL